MDILIVSRLDGVHCLKFLQIAERCKVTTDQVKNVIIWGNHSSTQFPDAAHGTVTRDGKELSIYDAVNNDTWLKGEFIEVRIL